MVHKQILVDEANRRQVDLRLLAKWFPKRNENRTFCKGGDMFWTIKWIVDLAAERTPLGTFWRLVGWLIVCLIVWLIDLLVLDTSALSLLSELLVHGARDFKSLWNIFQNISTDRFLDSTIKEQFTQLTADKPMEAFSFTLQLDPAHHRPTHLSVNLTPSFRLRGCLARRLIVEYPTILVRLKNPTSSSSTIESAISSDWFLFSLWIYAKWCGGLLRINSPYVLLLNLHFFTAEHAVHPSFRMFSISLNNSLLTSVSIERKTGVCGFENDLVGFRNFTVVKNEICPLGDFANGTIKLKSAFRKCKVVGWRKSLRSLL